MTEQQAKQPGTDEAAKQTTAETTGKESPPWKRAMGG